MPGTLASFDDGYYYPEVPVTCDICGSPSVKRVELECKTVTMREAERDIKVDKVIEANLCERHVISAESDERPIEVPRSTGPRKPGPDQLTIMDA